MHTITFQYYKRSWYGRLRNETFSRTLPENWNEVDSNFFKLFSKHFFGGTKTEGFIVEWAQLPKRVANRLLQYMHQEIISLLNPLFERPTSNIAYLPKLSIKLDDGKECCTFEKIAGCMSDMCFSQFVDADAFARAFVETKDEKHLRGLAAVLYRENPKEKYDSRFVEDRAEIIKRADTEDLKAIHLNFICLQNWLAATYPILYAEHTPTEDGVLVLEPTLPPNYVELAYKLASPKLGTVDQIEQMPVGYIFWLLCRRD